MADQTTHVGQVLTLSDKAMAKILEIRDREPDADELALRLEVTGTHGNAYTYDLNFEVLDPDPDDIVQAEDGLSIVMSEDSAEKLRGATLDLSRDLLSPGLVLDNPNTPSPVQFDPDAKLDLDGPLAAQIAQLLDGQINPSIAMHGGRADLVGVEGNVVYLRLSGGCQGCGMAQVTLRQGIEQAILHQFPEVTDIVDITDHAAGQNPYYH